MRYEVLDGPFSGVTTVDVQEKKLETILKIFLNSVFVLSVGFVVNDLNINIVTAGLKLCHNGIVGVYAMCVLFCRRGGLQGCVGVAMVGNHDVLIAAKRLV